MQKSTQNTQVGGTPAPASTSANTLDTARATLTTAGQQYATHAGTYADRHALADNLRQAAAAVDQAERAQR
jgi:hypothetical protein